jgi:hypothetical protein
MMSDFKVKVSRIFSDMKPDNAIEAPKNKEVIRGVLESAPGEGEEVLAVLLNEKVHYFDPGYRCPLTPEQLDKAIRDEIAWVGRVD